MKKPFRHTEVDTDIRCSNPKCATVNGIEGVVKKPIKKNVIIRSPEQQTKFLCYDCKQYKKTGLTRKQRKERGRKVVDNTETMHAGA